MTPRGDGPLDTSPAARYLVAAQLWLLLGLAAGFLYSLLYLGANPLEGLEVFSPGRVRMAHSQLMLRGFVLNVAWGGALWCRASWRIGGRLDRLDPLLFWLWQGLVLVSTLAILGGHARGVEWAESPAGLDAVFLLAWGLFWWRLVPGLWLGDSAGTPAAACLGGALTWLIGTLVVAHHLPDHLFPGDRAEKIQMLIVHESLGLGVAGVGIALFYHFFPLAVSQTLFSHRLAWAGIAAMMLAYPLHGLALFVELSLPGWNAGGRALVLGLVGTGALTVVVNTIGTLRGRGLTIRRSPATRWWLTGIGFYLVTGAQVIWQSLPETRDRIHYSDWVISHSHVSLFGVFGLFASGLLVQLGPRIIEGKWLAPAINVVAYWMVLVGLLGLGISLALAGLAQGEVWQESSTWISHLEVSRPYWLARTLFGALLIAGQGLLVLHLVHSWRSVRELRARRS